MMRILWVKMGGLWPCTSGGRVRSLEIISDLSRRHDITVMTTHGPEDDPDGLTRRLSRCDVTSVPYTVPKRGSAAFPATVARSWLSKYPVDLWKWRLAPLRRMVEQALRNDAIDLCVADFLFAAPNVPLCRHVPVVLFEHNVEHQIWQRLCALERSPWRRAIFELEWRKLRAREAEACTRATLTLAVSDDDRRRLAAVAPAARIATVPTGVDTGYFTPDEDDGAPHRLVFSGSMDWHPNEDAVLHFADAILPLIRARIPHVSFTVVGRNPSERLLACARTAGIDVTGTVTDVRPSIREAGVYVVPLRAGGGTRLKIFEALAMGKAVVSTTVGAEGLAIEPGRHFVAADDPFAFADAVVALIRNPELRRALAREGRALVEARYSWPVVASVFERRCEEVVAQHAQAATAAERRAHLSRRGPDRSGSPGLVAGKHVQLGWFHHHS
jgi:glycosyltransferase involved in cell wall biosynthesis